MERWNVFSRDIILSDGERPFLYIIFLVILIVQLKQYFHEIIVHSKNIIISLVLLPMIEYINSNLNIKT